MKISILPINFRQRPKQILFKKILFTVLLLLIWYYLLNPNFTYFKSFRERTKNIKTDNTILFTPNSGRGVLPVEAQVVLFAIDSFKLKDYNLFKTLGDHKHAEGNIAEIYQRINESAWPVPLDTNSRNLIGFTNELSTVPGIQIILQHKNISVGTY